jgi:hypothetical protein
MKMELQSQIDGSLNEYKNVFIGNPFSGCYSGVKEFIDSSI